MDSKTTILVTVLSSSGVFAIVGAFINGAFTKRKLGAEAAQIITQAASGVVTDLRQVIDDRTADMATMKADHGEAMAAMRAEHTAALEKQASEHAAEREEWRRVLQLHVAWDFIAIEKLSQVNVSLPPPPPILPPVR